MVAGEKGVVARGERGGIVRRGGSEEREKTEKRHFAKCFVQNAQDICVCRKKVLTLPPFSGRTFLNKNFPKLSLFPLT